jgi:putative isomerase
VSLLPTCGPLDSPYLQLLENRIDLERIPFSERGSRLMLFGADGSLSIRLAERWFRTEGNATAYRRRPPLVSNWVLRDAAGLQLDFQLCTYPHRIDCRTEHGPFTAVFVDPETLLWVLPPGRAGMSFDVRTGTGRADRRGGILRLTGPIGRSVVYTTNARLTQNAVSPVADGLCRVQLGFEAGDACGLLMNITPRLGYNRSLPDPIETIRAAARRWHEWFAAVPEVPDDLRRQYYYAWWVMRAGLISSRYYTTREAMTPSKPYYVGIWQWDAYFHALAYRHVDPHLAQDQLRILLDHQRADGMIPDAVHDEGVVTHLSAPVDADVTKPPLVAWTAWKLYEKDGNREFLDEIYEALVRWNDWWFEHSDTDRNGLCEYLHPYSSGLDDSPLWDEGMPVESPDLNTYLCLQQEALGRIAAAIGLEEDARLWAARADAMAQRMVGRMWDGAAGLFWALHNGEPVRLPRRMARRVVDLLTDPEAFWPEFPVPTVALDDPRHDPERMWRGPTWVNVNYLLIEGLKRTGFRSLAGELRRRTLQMIAGQPDIYEYYHPRTGVNPLGAAPVFGWSAALFIELALDARDSAGQLGRRSGRAGGGGHGGEATSCRGSGGGRNR